MLKAFLRGIFLLACVVMVPMVGRAEATESEETFDIDALSPQAILARARLMFPQEQFRVEGLLSVERTRGVRECAYPYTLSLNWAGQTPTAHCTLYLDALKLEKVMEAELVRAFSGTPTLNFIREDGSRLEAQHLNTPVGGTDLAWIDLAFDYLWWPNVRRLSDDECEAREIKPRQIGRNCVVLEAYPPVPTQGLGSVLLWADRSTGFVIQVQYLNEKGAPVRRLWVQRLGRENGRWVPRLFSVQRAGERRPRKTHLRIYTIRSASFSVDRLEDEE